jgi:hypothetical protein
MWPRRKPVRVRPVTPSLPQAAAAWRTAGDLGSARSHTPCTRVRFPLPRLTGQLRPEATAPLQGDGCGFDSRLVHAQRRHADVAQLGEARRSDRRQCRFESDRQYHLDVAQRERTGFGNRGLEVRALPSRPMRGGGTGTTPGSEPGGPRSNRGLAAIDVSAVVAHLDISIGLLRRRGFLHP